MGNLITISSHMFQIFLNISEYNWSLLKISKYYSNIFGSSWISPNIFRYFWIFPHVLEYQQLFLYILQMFLNILGNFEYFSLFVFKFPNIFEYSLRFPNILRIFLNNIGFPQKKQMFLNISEYIWLFFKISEYWVRWIWLETQRCPSRINIFPALLHIPKRCCMTQYNLMHVIFTNAYQHGL